MRELGFTPEHIVETAKALLKKRRVEHFTMSCQLHYETLAPTAGRTSFADCGPQVLPQHQFPRLDDPAPDGALLAPI
jgi:hypothetical protein